MGEPTENQSTPAQPPEKPNFVQQMIAAAAAALAKPIHALIQWGSTAKWKSALVVVALAAAGGTADHYLGLDNAVSHTIQQEQAAPLDTIPSPTEVMNPPADAPLAPPALAESGTSVEPPATVGE